MKVKLCLTLINQQNQAAEAERQGERNVAGGESQAEEAIAPAHLYTSFTGSGHTQRAFMLDIVRDIAESLVSSTIFRVVL